MPDPRFFQPRGPFTLQAIADACGAELGPGVDGARVFRDVAPLDDAGPEHLSFLDNPRFVPQFQATRAGACIIHPKQMAVAPPGVALLLSKAPYRAYGLAARHFHPPADVVAELGVHPTAVVDPSVRVGADCRVGAYAVIAAGVEIGAGSQIGAGCVIGAGVVLGEDCRIHPQATISHARVGAQVTIYPGTRIGQDGFGFAPDPRGHVSIPQLGRVLIGDDVEIGANATIDRGAGSDTVIGPGCRLDNQVHLAHNVVLGRGCILTAQIGVSGSTQFGDFVVVGGQSGFAGHLSIGTGARIAAKSGVINDVPAGASYGGYPAVPVRDWHRQTVTLKHLSKKKGMPDG